MKLNNNSGIAGRKNIIKTREAVFWCLFVLMAIYYGFRLVALTPWYDELYTYYFFISRGPAYAAIHWPLPNNHVGYSVLSACLDKLGNSYIGLRGVSYLAALLNIRLLYRITKRYFKDWMPIGVVILYISMNLVNQLAVQGRGYTLGITCFLTALFCILKIGEEENASKHIYFFYVLSLVLGLYAVTSNVYWVLPLCLAGGLYLLSDSITEGKRNTVFFLKTSAGKRLLKLILASLIAAILTIGLYTVIWVAIGSNLLVKDTESIYFGMGHVDMILKAPFQAISHGMEYMLDTPYIQSEERAGFAARLGSFFVTLFGYYFDGLQFLMLGICLLGMLWLLYRLLLGRDEKTQSFRLLYLVVLLGMAFVPVCLWFQCKRPYYRVFTYGGVLLALLLGLLLHAGVEKLKKHIRNAGRIPIIEVVTALVIVLLGVKSFFFSDYNQQYSMREHEIEDAWKHGNITENTQLCVTDCNQQYLLFFLYGIRCENQVVEGSDLLLLDKRMQSPDFNEMVWEFYHYYNTLPWDYIDENLEQVYENDNYVLYETFK